MAQRVTVEGAPLFGFSDPNLRAFVPHPLPPVPDLVIDPELREQLDQAHLALGRLDMISALLPDPGLFLYMYVRKEAVLSSQIEGTQSSLSDLMLFELGEAPGVPQGDVQEVSNYVAALAYGMEKVQEAFPISVRLIRELHRILMRKGRGENRHPGEFRRTQNWIGGANPKDAVFIPPPHTEVPNCMAALERFLNNEPQRTPVLIRAALGHVQFETIHPFLDGNGRIGRLLIPLLLCQEKVLRQPLLYLSLYFKRHRGQYYDLLQKTRLEGDWESWISFFARGVEETARSAVTLVETADRLFQDDRQRIHTLGKRAGSALRVHEALRKHPVLTINRMAERIGLSIPTVGAMMTALGPDGLGIVRELTERRRDRVFAYDRYFALLSEGAEPF